MTSPMTTARPQQRYDHRLRKLVQRTGDLTIATDLGAPRSTARGQLDQTVDEEHLADFCLATIQRAMLLGKVKRSSELVGSVVSEGVDSRQAVRTNGGVDVGVWVPEILAPQFRKF